MRRCVRGLAGGGPANPPTPLLPVLVRGLVGGGAGSPVGVRGGGGGGGVGAVCGNKTCGDSVGRNDADDEAEDGVDIRCSDG